MPPKKDEDSKKGLVITLVIFVLITIVLGIVSYYGFADQQRLTDQYMKEKKDKDTMEKNRDWERFQALLLKADLGYQLSKEDQEALTVARTKYDGGELGKGQNNKDEVDKLIQTLDAQTAWDADKKQPKNTYIAQVADLSSKLKDKQAMLDRVDTETKKNFARLTGDLRANQSEKDELAKKLADANKAIADAKEAKSKEYIKALKDIEQRNDEVSDLQKKVELAKDEQKKAVNKLNSQLKDSRTQTEKLKDQIHPPNVLDFEKSKGHITLITRDGREAYISLGSADYVQPQLTFSVFGSDSKGKATAARKGALQVADIRGPHLSIARITDISNAGGDPIVAGDLLYNPVWNSGVRQHIAFAGLIDLTGEDRDDSEEFIRNLAKQSILVDAYLDLKDMTVKGKIKYQTAFLVIGDEPELDAASLSNLSDPRTTRKTDMMNKISDMRNEATKLGVQIVPLRRFLALVGYPTPRVLGKSKTSSFGTAAGLSVGNKEPKEGTDKEKATAKPKAEKEGDSDKPEKEKMEKEKPGKEKAEKEDAPKEKEKDKEDKDKEKDK